QLRFELVDKRKRRARRLVAPVEHRVNRNPARAVRRGDVEQRHQMIDMTVHAAVGKQSPDMQRRAESDGLFYRMEQRRIAGESVALDRFRDSQQVLVDDEARAGGGMTDFGIALHARRQSHRIVRCVELGMSLRRVEPVHHRSLRRGDRVRRAALADSPSIENHQRCNRRPLGHYDFPPAALRLKADPPGYCALAPSSSAIRSSRLYFAVRSDRLIDPVLICPAPVATARSAMVVSSVSPERCEITLVYPAARAISIVARVSLSVPIWLSLMRIELATCSSIPRLRNLGLVTKMSSPTSCVFAPSSRVRIFQPAQSSSASGSSSETIGYFLSHPAYNSTICAALRELLSPRAK